MIMQGDLPARPGQLEAGSPLRTPRAAAAAGMAFALLTATSLILLRLSTPADPASASQWLSDTDRRKAVSVALNLVPFAGIAFLWFVGVLRDRIGGREDRFFATVFLGSGLLFVGMFFSAAAIAGGLLGAAASHTSGTPGSDTLALGRGATSLLLNVYSMRMAAVFTITTVTIARQTKIIARWLWAAGLVTAAVLLVGVSFSGWLELLFPAWIMALSIDMLARGGDPGAHGGRAAVTHGS
jgi:hypothetical protein